MRLGAQQNQTAGYELVDDFQHWITRALARLGREATAREINALGDLYLDGYCVVDALELLPHM
jgi:hypothetical protein